MPDEEQEVALASIRSAAPLEKLQWVQDEPPSQFLAWTERTGKKRGVVVVYIFDKTTEIPTDYGQMPAGDETNGPISGGENTSDLVPVAEDDDLFKSAKSVAIFVDVEQRSVVMLKPFSFDFTNYGTGC